MSLFAPIQVGNSNRIPSMLNKSTDVYVLKNPKGNTKTLQRTFSGPILSYAAKNSKPMTVAQDFRKNKGKLYSRPSPYTHYGFGPKQPFVVKKPGKGRGRFDDVVRIAKFSVTGKGLLFYLKQFLIQRQAIYDETKIYNPLGPIMSAAKGVIPFLAIPSPKRHIDTGGGLLGGLLSAIGIPPKDKPIKGTSEAKNANSLPKQETTAGYKGLLRASTGARARSSAMVKFGQGGKKKGGFFASLKSSISGFLGLGKPNQFKDLLTTGGGLVYRADQDFFWYYATNFAYGRKYENTSKYYGVDKMKDFVPRLYLPPDTNLNKGSDKLLTLPYLMHNKDGKYDLNQIDADSYIVKKLKLVEIKKSRKINPPFRMWIEGKFPLDHTFNFSHRPPTKFSDASPLKPEPISKSKDLNKHTVELLKKGNITLSPSKVYLNYTQLGKNTYFPENDNKKSAAIKTMAGSGEADKINLYGAEESIGGLSSFIHDAIVFNFFDVVNSRYITFRAILTAISDNDTAEWEDVKFIGRPDPVYNYKGYSRTLNFSFVVNINSIRELLPTWTRINYLKGFTKPSKYVDDKYMVPPMIKIKIGDIYNNTPTIINSINMNIPDDAPWETIPFKSGEFNYGNGLIKIEDQNMAQYPTRVEISINASVIETNSSPSIGKAYFGTDKENFDITTEV